ncbi:MAG: AAA family ATPase, partial [Selenomonadaceae bacterium]|nr:AAA family ATPase [Selenomonadaceae bacterium]
MPVGVDDFKRVREEYYYMDKTDFIKSLIDAHSQATLITRPRRFGKTLALSMLYYFF